MISGSTAFNKTSSARRLRLARPAAGVEFHDAVYCITRLATRRRRGVNATLLGSHFSMTKRVSGNCENLQALGNRDSALNPHAELRLCDAT